MNLWFERLGPEDGPPLLLISGRGDDAGIWPRCALDGLVKFGFSVVRFDQRDTGLSPDGPDTGVLADLADDAAAVLDDAGVPGPAHVVGLSMGGFVLLDLATRHPDRVASATFLSAISPDPGAGFGPDFFEQVDADPVQGRLAAMAGLDPDDATWVADEVAAATARAPARPEAGARHMELTFRSAFPDPALLAEVACPTAVLHGSADRTLPVAHAEALATIPGATLHVLDGMGHLPTRRQWDEVLAVVRANASSP